MTVVCGNSFPDYRVDYLYRLQINVNYFTENFLISSLPREFLFVGQAASNSEIHLPRPPQC